MKPHLFKQPGRASSLIKADLYGRHPPWFEQSGKLRCDAAIVVEPLLPGKKRGMGFMVQHVARKHRMAADIGGINENQVEPFGYPPGPIPLLEMGAGGKVKALGICLGNGQGVLRDIDADSGGVPPLVKSGEKKRARTSAKIQHPPWRPVAKMGHRRVEQGLGIRPGNENRWRDVKGYGPEIALASDIGNRLPSGPPFDEGVELAGHFKIAQL